MLAIVISVLFLLMLCLGLELSLKDFARLFHRPKAVLAGLSAQMIGLPLIAFLLCALFPLPPEYAVGVMLLAACPGGASSNAFTMLAEGDTALSVSLTAIASLLSILTLPAVVLFALRAFAGNGLLIGLPVQKVLFQIFALVLFPVLMGMGLRAVRPETASSLHRFLRKISLPMLLAMVTLFVLKESETIFRPQGPLLQTMCALIFAAMAMGAAVGAAFKLNRREKRAVVVEVGIQNAAQAISIALSPFLLNNVKMAVPAVLYAVLMNLALVGFLFVCRVSDRRSNRPPASEPESPAQPDTSSTREAVHGALHAWLLAVRPKTLPASVAPVIVGAALAIGDGGFRLLPAVAAMICSVLLQIGVNLANDYFDFKKGIDGPERLGPIRVTTAGLIPPGSVLKGMIATFALALSIGGYLVWVGGWPILAVGVASVLAALSYSGGPFPLASTGLGDLAVFVFFGLIAVNGAYYVQTHTLNPTVILLSAPVGFLITAILVVNNLRDIYTDEKAGKITLAVMIGERGTRIEFTALLAAAYVIPILAWRFFNVSAWAMILPMASLPMAATLLRNVVRNEGDRLNKALAHCARLSLVFSLLLAIGIVL